MYQEPDWQRAYGVASARARQIPADRHHGSAEDFLRRHEREAQHQAQGNRTQRTSFAGNLLSRAGDFRNVILAIDHCASRGQAAGPDGLRPANLNRQGRRALARALCPLIRQGIYRPGKTFLKVISKGRNRGTRTITIQNVTDRVVERAILQIIRPILEEYFLGCSFGYRDPARSREEALLTAERLANDQNRWIWISQDLRDAFDNVPRARLIQVLRQMIPNDELCTFVERITRTNQRKGIRQGGPLSPTLLNVYLHHMLDTWWMRRFPDITLLRFADDLLILARPDEVSRINSALRNRSREIAMPLKHTPEATICDLMQGQTVEWMGYSISKEDTGIRMGIADKAWDKLEEKLCLASEEPIPCLYVDGMIRGWIGQQGAAYDLADVSAVHAEIVRLAQEKGYDEIPSQEEIASLWHQAHLRDWVGLRGDLLLRERLTTTTGADGSADQTFDFASLLRRSGAGHRLDVLPRQANIRREVYLYCDGSYLRSANVGGWAFLLAEPCTGWQHGLAGAEWRTTNNRMELQAVIQGLRDLAEPTRVRLVVDSEYVHLGITQRLAKWERNGWRAGTRRHRRLLNQDLWLQLAQLLQQHDVRSHWVRGHSGHPQNEIVDHWANAAARQLSAVRGG